MARRFLTPELHTAPQAAYGTVPPVAASHVVQWHLHGAAVKAAVAGNILLALFFFAAVIWRVFFTGSGTGGGGGGGQHERAAAAVSPHAQEGAADGGAFSSSDRMSTPAACAAPRSRGLGKADLLALPVYVHGSSGDEVGEGTTVVECAVCLGELRDGDTGRVLPRCGHRFHAECVDRWFRLHVTCPLCRAVVVVADGGSVKSTKVHPGV